MKIDSFMMAILFFVGIYVLGGITWAAVDYLYEAYKKRRQARILDGRLHLLKEFAEGKRVA